MSVRVDNEPLSILVDAPLEDVKAALREELSEDDFAKLDVGMVKDPEEDLLGSLRGIDDQGAMIAAVHFVAGAIASGYTHDLFKAVLSALRRRLGQSRVFAPRTPETTEPG